MRQAIANRIAAQRTGCLAALVLFLRISASAQAAQMQPPPRLLLISIPDRKMALIEGGHVLNIYPVAVGAKHTPSPSGVFTVINRLVKPTYYHPGTVIEPGANNPLGSRWIGLSHKGYGIHGTNVPRSIGKAASHGCIRMAKGDVEQLFEQVRVGDVVEIRAEADDETAAIFGNRVIVAQAQTGAVALSAGGQ